MIEFFTEAAKEIPSLSVLAWIVWINQKSVRSLADHCHECQDRSSAAVQQMAAAVADVSREVQRIKDTVERR